MKILLLAAVTAVGLAALAPSAGSVPPDPPPFVFTGANQSLPIPAGVTQILVTVFGAGGGNGNPSPAGGTGGAGGGGAAVQAVISVTPAKR